MLSLYPILALPIAAATCVAAVSSRFIANTVIDGNTTVNGLLVLAGVGALVKFVSWFSSERMRDRIERRTQNELIRLIILRSRDIDENNDMQVKQLLIQLNSADPKRNKGKHRTSRDENGR